MQHPEHIFILNIFMMPHLKFRFHRPPTVYIARPVFGSFTLPCKLHILTYSVEQSPS